MLLNQRQETAQAVIVHHVDFEVFCECLKAKVIGDARVADRSQGLNCLGNVALLPWDQDLLEEVVTPGHV